MNRGQSGGGGVLPLCHAARLTGQDNNKTGIYLNHLAFQSILQTSIPGSCLLPAFGKVVISMLTWILIWERITARALSFSKTFPLRTNHGT